MIPQPQVVVPRPTEPAVPPVSRPLSVNEERISVETQHSEDAGRDRAAAQAPVPGVVPVLVVAESGDGDVVSSARAEPVLEVNQPQGVGQLEHAASEELMASVELPIREMVHYEPAVVDVSVGSEVGVREPVRESTPPAAFIEGLLRESFAPKPDPKITSPIKIEFPLDPKTLRVLCSFDEIAKHEAGLQRAYPVIVGAEEDAVAFMVGNDPDREAVVKWHAAEAEKTRQAAPNRYRLREFVWRDRAGEYQPWAAVLEPLRTSHRSSARNLTDEVNRMWAPVLWNLRRKVG